MNEILKFAMQCYEDNTVAEIQAGLNNPDETDEISRSEWGLSQAEYEAALKIALDLLMAQAA